MSTVARWALSAPLLAWALAACGCGGAAGSAGSAGRAPAPAAAPRKGAEAPTKSVAARCLFNSEDLRKRNLSLGTDCACAEGRLLVQASDNIYDPRSWMPVAGEALATPLHFAADSDGTLYAVSGGALGVLVGGIFSKLTELPALGFSVKAAASGLILWGPAPEGRSVVYRLTRTDKGGAVIRQTLVVEGAIAALEPLGDDFVFAQENSVFQAGLVRNGKVAVAFLLAMAPASKVASLAYDASRRVLFVSTSSETFAVRGGKAVPILAFGGALALGGRSAEKLYVCRAASSSALEVDLPALFRGLADQMRAPAR
jgi:hypothetical protein